MQAIIFASVREKRLGNLSQNTPQLHPSRLMVKFINFGPMYTITIISYYMKNEYWKATQYILQKILNYYAYANNVPAWKLARLSSR